jgi:hypothetical protein
LSARTILMLFVHQISMDVVHIKAKLSWVNDTLINVFSGHCAHQGDESLAFGQELNVEHRVLAQFSLF